MPANSLSSNLDLLVNVLKTRNGCFKSVVIDAVDFKIYTPNVQVYICRFIATVLLHMELIEDVKQGLNMIHFLNTHPEKFSNIGIPFCIGMM